METYFVQNKQAVFEMTQMNDEWFLVDIKGFTITKLDQLSGFCWSLLNEAHNLPMLIEEVIHYFFWQEDRGIIEHTIRQRIKELLSKELIYSIN